MRNLRENQDTEWMSNQDTEWMLNQDTEWLLNPDILSDALDRLDIKPEIDLFASRLNHQFSRYISYKPDLDAEAVNAFTMSWSDVIFCAFPPFCIIPSVLQKIIKDRARGILVVPDWPSQPWYPIIIGKGTKTETCPRVSEGKSTCLANKPGSKTQTAKGTTFDYMRSIRKRLRSSGFSQTTSSVICSSWRSGTSRQYATYIARWKRYANKQGIHSVSQSVSHGVNFLGMLFSAGLSYSAICLARSALSSYLDCKDAAQFGEHKLVYKRCF